MAIALGAKFTDKNGLERGIGGGELSEISSINLSGLDARIKQTEVLVACDVTNPMTGVEGAAGGLGAGLMAFLNAQLKQGFVIIREETQLDKYVEWADLVITGEGKIDRQTQFGKTPIGVMRTAKAYGKPVVAVAGILGEGYEELYALGFDAIFSILDKPMNLEEALKKAPCLIERCMHSIIRLFFLQGNKSVCC